VLARTDYHAVAAAFGAHGIVVKQMSELQPALAAAAEAAARGKPVLVNVWLDKTEFREGSLSM
jgi:thiamine pyrophosphate-dependent acetolactate synthase large subunit-like protein